MTYGATSLPVPATALLRLSAGSRVEEPGAGLAARVWHAANVDDSAGDLYGADLRALLTHRRMPGRLSWTGVRPEGGAPMRMLSEALVHTNRGIDGDRASLRSGGKRQISLIQAEHLPVIAARVGRAAVEPELLRRNLVVRGINLAALRHTRFRIGEVVLQGTGDCDPCSKMERALRLEWSRMVRGA